MLSHDSFVGSHGFVAPGSVICCSVRIGEACFVGANTIIYNLSIGSDVILGAGSVVVKNLYEPGLYVGNPVKRMDK